MTKKWEVVDTKAGAVEINATRVAFWAQVWGTTLEKAAKRLAARPFWAARVAA